MIAVPFATARLPQPYRAWNELLAEELFPRGRAGVPVYLAVHDGLLNDCGARRGCGGRDDFVRAVLGLSTTPERLFVRLEQLAELWSENGRGGEPPIIAGLAFAVLAAGEMATDENATQANYYFRLSALMGIENRGKPERFEYTPDLWKLLQEWLRLERRGELIVHGLDSQHPFVDPVQSQCLVRSCDLPDLLPILSALEHPPGQDIEPDDILPALRAWLLGAGAGSRLSRLLRRDPDDTALTQAAEALCNAVEDLLPNEQPLAAAEMQTERTEYATLAVRPNAYPNLMWKRARWLIRLTADIDAEEPECLVLVGQRVVIARLDVREPASYDAEISHEEAVALLREAIRVLDENDHDVTPPRRPLAWLQDGALRGRPGSWALVEAPGAGIEHALVFLSSNTLDDIQAALERPAVSLVGAADIWPGPDTNGACSVVPRNGAVLPGGIIVRTRRPILRLTGGLRIRRGVYLRGALPTPAVPETSLVRVESVGGSGAASVAAAGAFGSLDLPEGPYTLRCDGAATDIFVVEPRWRECAFPTRVALLDRAVTGALRDATLRGACLEVEHLIYAAHFRPGTHYRLYAPNVVKGLAPADAGVHEHLTSQPIKNVTLMKRMAASAPLPRADCFSESSGSTFSAASEQQRDAMNLLLEYASARGTGSVDVVRPHCTAIVAGGAWHRALSTLEDIGHLDVSWDNSRTWTVARPLGFPRPGDSGYSIITGARSRQTVAWLNEHGIAASVDARANGMSRSVMPDCIVAPTEALARATEALLEVGLRLLPEPPSMQMALQARPLADRSWWLGPQFSPPIARIRQTLQRWEPRQLRWAEASDVGETALYRWRERGRRIHYLVTDAIGATVRDPSAAKWFLAPADRSYLVYEPGARRLLVPNAIELPRIWKRICALASGLTPGREGRLLVYEDVPLDLARATAVRLNQKRAEGLL